MKGKKEEMRIPMKFEGAVADFLKVKPQQKKPDMQQKVTRRKSTTRPVPKTGRTKGR